MASAPRRSPLDIARAVEAVVEADDGVVGLDRTGHAMTVGRGAAVRGVRAELGTGGKVSARLEVVGLSGTVLTEAGERLTAAIVEEFDRLGVDGSVVLVFTDLGDPEPEDEDR